MMTDLPDYEPEQLSESLPDQAGEDDRIIEAYRCDDYPTPLRQDPQSQLVDELLNAIRQANAPRPLVILEREQADFLRNLLLDLLAASESSRYSVDRLRIGLDLLDGRTRE